MTKYVFDRSYKLKGKEYSIGDDVPDKIPAKEFQFLKSTGTILKVKEEEDKPDLEKLNGALEKALKKTELEKEGLEVKNKELEERIAALETENQKLTEAAETGGSEGE